MLSPATSSIAFNGCRNLPSLRLELQTPEALKPGAISAAGKVKSCKLTTAERSFICGQERSKAKKAALTGHRGKDDGFFMADSQLGPCHRAPAPPGRLIPPPRNQRKACAAGQDVQHQQDMATGI